MKFTKRITIMFAALLTAGVALYANESIDGWEISTRNGECTLIKPLVGKYRKDAVVIPDQVGEYTVTALGDNLFAGIDKITSVEIPNSIKTIGEAAFRNCTGLTSVAIPDSVTKIDIGAFGGCTSLTTINYIGNLEKWLTINLQDSSFPNKGAMLYIDGELLTNVIIPSGITSIRRNAFGNCTSLTSVEIPNSVTKIEYGAFGGCTSLTSVEIPDSVISIGDRAFSGCTGLTSITIPNSVKTIGDNAFGDCTSLTSVEISYKITSLNASIFKGCTSLINVDIPYSVTKIEYGAFEGCTSLKSIEIPDSVTKIGRFVFSGCKNLKDINRPKGISEIGWFAALKSSGLEAPFPNGKKYIVSDADYKYILAEDAKGTFYFYHEYNGDYETKIENKKIEKYEFDSLYSRGRGSDSAIINAKGYTVYRIYFYYDYTDYNYYIVKTPRGNYYLLR